MMSYILCPGPHIGSGTTLPQKALSVGEKGKKPSGGSLSPDAQNKQQLIFQVFKFN